MKTMKRIVAGLLVVGMMLALVGCGSSEEKTVTLRTDMSADVGLPSTDTMILTAKGDTIQQMKEITEIDMTGFDEDYQQAIADLMDAEVVSVAEGIDGVTCTSKITNSVYTIELTIDCTNGTTVKAAAEAGIIEIEDGLIDKLSLKRTQSGLEASGYTVVE